MQLRILFFLILGILFSNAQMKGTVLDENNKPIAHASVSIEKTYIGTTTNENGNFELNTTQTSGVVVVSHLGYITLRVPFNTTAKLQVQLKEQTNSIEAVVVKNTENPANEIIRNAIANRKQNVAKTNKFEADFYSRGIFRVKDLPKKIMGVEIGDMEGNVDSTGNGIIYQSETVSKIKFEAPNNLKEEIIASKVAGNDNGFSFNNAIRANFNFYENTLNFNVPMISPIASNAFNYYKYKIEDSFVDAYNNFVYKIKVTPKRDKEPVFDGFIYIVDVSFALYAIDLNVKGYRAQQPILENLNLVQNYSFNPDTKIWAKNQQIFDFKAGLFGIKFNGKYTHVFTNYMFKDVFEKKTFTNEVVSFAEKANKKENIYWEQNRPVPLTEEEQTNYIKKDSVFKVRNSMIYLDSIDHVKNKFKLTKVVTGYTYSNTFKKWNFNYEGLLNFSSFNFNTIQGFHLGSGFSFTKFNEEKQSNTRISINADYGFSDKRFRPVFVFNKKFNNTNDFYFYFEGGNKVAQFNRENPITNLANSVSTLFFKNNFMKLYEKDFAEIALGRELLNGLFVNGKLAIENRKPLFNTTDFTIIKSDDKYSSNNPFLPSNDLVAVFSKHQIVKLNLGTKIVFGQKYITRPDGKIKFNQDKYPVISLNYEKGFLASSANYNFDYLETKISYGKQLGNKGDISANVKAGKFFNAAGISFVDYKHFNGNLTHIQLNGSGLNSFGILPYYQLSTNNHFLETHLSYTDNGYFTNKIPLINKLGWNLLVGCNLISTPKIKPYQEFSIGLDRIGFGKFKILKVEYFRAYQGAYVGDGVLFGLRF